jgi:predicted amidohydrolase
MDEGSNGGKTNVGAAAESRVSGGVSRRDLLAGAGLAGAGLAALAATPALAATGADARSPASGGASGTAAATAGASARDATVSVSKKGVYATVPLRQDAINVSAIQSRVNAVDVRNLKPTLKANLDHVIELIDVAQGSVDAWGNERLWGTKQDLIVLHEFPFQGFQPWSRKELLKVAIDLPGPEVERIGAKAKQYDCYVAFGCYAREQGWPDHVINMSVIVGPDGSIVSKQWKTRNILGMFYDGALLGTTIYDVLDRYVEMYGADAVVPVARTPIGNITMTAVGAEPMLYTAQALKGAEIQILTVSGGSNADAAIACARANRTYCVGVGNSVTPNNIGFAEAAGAQDGGTAIVDPRGTRLASSANHHEDVVSARIPIADFRKTRRMPEFPMAALLPVFQQYEPVFQPNAFLEYLPTDYKDSGAYVRRRMEAARKK